MAFADLLDNAIFTLFPERGARRRLARQSFAVEQRKLEQIAKLQAQQFAKFEGAIDDRFRGSSWLTSKLSMDSALETDLLTLRDNSRDLQMNDPIFGGAVEALVSNVVGCGIRPQAAIAEDKEIGMTKTRAEELNGRLEDKWKLISGQIGVDDESIEELQEQVIRSQAVDGDGMIVMSDLPSIDRMIPLRLQVVNAERLETPPEKSGNDRIRMGIERDGTGRRVRYWIREQEVGDTRATKVSYKPYDRDRVCHVFQPLAAGMSRGVPWNYACQTRFKDIKDLVEAELIGCQVAACFSVIIETQANPFELATGAASETRDGKRIQEIEPGKILYTKPGEKPHFAAPNRPGGTFAPFLEWLLRTSAAALNYPYELLAKNYAGLSYSAGRLSLIDGRLAFRSRQKRLCREFLQQSWKRAVAELVVLGQIAIDPVEYRQMPWVFEACNWIAPGWPWIDPVKEVKADSDAVSKNLSTLADVLAARGLDWEEVLVQRSREEKRTAELGLQALAGAGVSKPVVERPTAVIDPNAPDPPPDGDPAQRQQPAVAA